MTVAAFSISHHDIGLSPLSHAWVYGQDCRIASPSTRSASTSGVLDMDLQVSNLMTTTTTPSSTIPSTSFFDSASPSNLEQIAFSTISPPSSEQAMSSRDRDRESHHDKRIKVELPNASTAASSAVAVAVTTAPGSTSVLDSNINHLGQFDDRSDDYESFEIDYTKFYSQTNQSNFQPNAASRLGTDAYMKANRASGARAPAMRTLVEEDFFDDSAFDNALSEDEDMIDNQKGSESLPESESLPQSQTQTQTDTQTQPRAQMQTQTQTTSSLPNGAASLLSVPPTWDRSQMPGNMQPAPMGMPNAGASRRMDGAMWEAMQQRSSGMFTLSPDERRRLIEIAMGPSAPPMYAPANRFNFNSMGDGLFWPPVQQIHPPNPISMMFGIGNDPAALRFLSTETPGAFDPSLTAARPGQDLGQNQQQQPQPKADTTMTNTTPAKAMTPDANASANAASALAIPKRSPPAEAHQPTAAAATTAATAAAKTRSADRVAHNDVERKYRTNLRDKISELRNAVPVLRQAYDAERSSSNTTAHSKVSKGTVLTKAIEYIHQLEQRNRDIMAEHQQLAQRLQAFETLFNNSMYGADMMPSHSMSLFDPRGFC